jgi:hypothetical protein
MSDSALEGARAGVRGWLAAAAAAGVVYTQIGRTRTGTARTIELFTITNDPTGKPRLQSPWIAAMIGMADEPDVTARQAEHEKIAKAIGWELNNWRFRCQGGGVDVTIYMLGRLGAWSGYPQHETAELIRKVQREPLAGC